MTALARAPAATERRRVRLDVAGRVQGVGFRPFVHRLAVDLGLAGFVRNTADGATLEVEGPAEAVERLLARLDAGLPAPAGIVCRRVRALVPTGTATSFSIATSTAEAPGEAMPVSTGRPRMARA